MIVGSQIRHAKLLIEFRIGLGLAQRLQIFPIHCESWIAATLLDDLPENCNALLFIVPNNMSDTYSAIVAHQPRRDATQVRTEFDSQSGKFKYCQRPRAQALHCLIRPFAHICAQHPKPALQEALRHWVLSQLALPVFPGRFQWHGIKVCNPVLIVHGCLKHRVHGSNSDQIIASELPRALIPPLRNLK